MALLLAGGLAGMAGGSALAARPGMAAELAAINASFVCPETLPTDADRKAFSNALSQRLAAQRLTYQQASKVVQTIYGLHRCGAAHTPAASGQSAEAAQGAAPTIPARP